MKSRIIGTGSYLPSKILTNFDLEKMVDTSDEWITTRSGIKERRIAAGDETSSTLGIEAAKRALKNAGIKKENIDLIVVSTLAPDYIFPSTACLIQSGLGIKNSSAFDVIGACTGFLMALSIADKYVKSGVSKYALVVAAECVSRFVDWKDRNTCVLFGDGAGAAVLTGDKKYGIIGESIYSNGDLSDILCLPGGGGKYPASEETLKKRMHYIKMDGTEVYKAAVRTMSETSTALLEKTGIKKESIDYFIPHQANLRIIDSLRKRLNLPLEKVMINVDKYGNTSSATIPIGLDEAVKNNIIKTGDMILMTAAGGGFTYGSMIIKY
ncbi:MAG TPA: beta-ketoacyl-ACP synthase III [bacterium]|nr:beta-ketoacyl-ACP synthase III [bacterium]HPN30050.1 beta-ketoacyl-ACP synthase III [bacterium]